MLFAFTITSMCINHCISLLSDIIFLRGGGDPQANHSFFIRVQTNYSLCVLMFHVPRLPEGTLRRIHGPVPQGQDHPSREERRVNPSSAPGG